MKKLIVAMALALALTNSQAANIDIFEFSSFVNADEITGDSLIDRQVFNPSSLSAANEFGTTGLLVSFTNSLNADNMGSVTWSVTNNSGGALNNVEFFGFLDAEIDESLNTYFNESGDASSLVLGSGIGDTMADSWGIGDPFSDNIFLDILDASLTNINTVPAGLESDVSMALGFNIGSLAVDESFSVTFNLSLLNNGGLMQFDGDSDTGFFFNGSVQNFTSPVPVPAPAPLFLIGIGLLAVRFFSNKNVIY